MPLPLDQLNAPQRRAVETVEGRVLVLAGAGSGKTSVLTLRMAHLISDHGVAPEALLGLTFTNKAAGEMRARLASWIAPALASRVLLGTFHSFCLRVLRGDIHRLGYASQFTIYDESDVQHLIKQIVRDILKYDGELPSLGPLTHTISAARSRGLTAAQLAKTQDIWHDDFAIQVYGRYLESLRLHNAVDFDGMLYLCLELLENFPEVRDHYQERFRYLMVDEYQDTNAVQARLSQLLSQRHGNLCVVGDDDQSIYGWRGADVRNILDFSGATVIKLEQNYRSTNTILQAANAVIRNNEARHDKNLWSDQGSGCPIAIFHVANEVEEAQAVVYRIVAMKQRLGLRWRDFAILYRSNALSRQFEFALMKYRWRDEGELRQGVPYQITGGTSFYERKEVRDLIAYLRLIVNSDDETALLRVINYPRRGIGDSSLETIVAQARQQGKPLWQVLQAVAANDMAITGVTTRARKGVVEFVSVVESARGRFVRDEPTEALLWLLEAIGYRRAIADEAKDRQTELLKWENVEELVSALDEYVSGISRGEDASYLCDFLAGVQLEVQKQRLAQENDGSDDKVNLLTFHSAKGCEFAACFLVGMEDHIMPHERSVLESGLEEERRLMYVALTRAKRFLTVSMATSRRQMGATRWTEPSRFLNEIPKELLLSTSGLRVDEAFLCSR